MSIVHVSRTWFNMNSSQHAGWTQTEFKWTTWKPVSTTYVRCWPEELSWDLSFESSTKKPGYIQGWTPGYIQGWTPTDLLVNKNLFPSYVSWWPLELDGKLLKARNLYCALRFFSINLKIFQLNITFVHECVCVAVFLWMLFFHVPE